MASSSGGNSGGVPPGFRFHPTDEELLHYYLKKKVTFQKFEMEVIREVDLNKMEPWDLQERCKIGSTPQNEYYFFSHKDRKYPTGSRTNRATSAGFWKATGRDKCIRNTFKKIGMRKTLVFYRGRAPHGQKTDWIMHEYRLEDGDDQANSTEDGWVVCRVFKKKNLFRVGGEGSGSGGGASSNSHSNGATTSNQLLGIGGGGNGDDMNGQSQTSLMLMHQRLQGISGSATNHHHQQQHNYMYMKPELGLHNFSQFQMPLLGTPSHDQQYSHQPDTNDQSTSMELYDFSRLPTHQQSPIMLKQLMTSSNSTDQHQPAIHPGSASSGAGLEEGHHHQHHHSLNDQCVMIDHFVQQPQPHPQPEDDEGDTNGETNISQMGTTHQQNQHSLHSEMDFWGYKPN